MTADATRPELPAEVTRADERATLAAMVDFYRAVLLRKTWGLTDEQLGTPYGTSEMSLGGLLFHMALVEDFWFEHRFAGRAEPEPWASAPWDDDKDWEFHTAPTLSHDALVVQFELSVSRSRAVVDAEPSLDTMAALTNKKGEGWNLRWILVHMIEEYARHCGHADLMRESIDGVTGD